MPAIKAGRKRKNPASPVLAALPVVCSTNHGRAIIVSVLPTSEIVFALSSDRSGARRAGDISVMVVSRFISLFPTLRRSPLEAVCNLVHTQCAKLFTVALDALEDQVAHRHHHAHKDHEDR